MSMITIVGGGLAGLSLGIALKKRGFGATVHEALAYPRHRVCGEFICGVSKTSLQDLGVCDALRDARLLRTTAWFRGGECLYRAPLPVPALGISRYALDQRLADTFREAGGMLRTRERFGPKNGGGDVPEPPGVVWTAGRQVVRSEWIGLKMHALDLETRADLELHLGDHAYAGVSAVEDGRVNVCGLFRKRRGVRARKPDLLPAYLEASGLTHLAGRLRSGEPDPASACGIDSVDFTRTFDPPSRCYLGDTYSAIPPFTGNGMSMAFECAADALDPLARWLESRIAWPEAVGEIRASLHRRFRSRLTVARALHPFIYKPAGQSMLAIFAKARLLPFRTLFQMTH